MEWGKQGRVGQGSKTKCSVWQESAAQGWQDWVGGTGQGQKGWVENTGQGRVGECSVWLVGLGGWYRIGIVGLGNTSTKDIVIILFGPSDETMGQVVQCRVGQARGGQFRVVQCMVGQARGSLGQGRAVVENRSTRDIVIVGYDQSDKCSTHHIPLSLRTFDVLRITI